MALIVPSDEIEEMLLEDQLDSEGQMRKEQWTKPSFNRALLLLVVGVLVCIVSVATLRFSNLSSFKASTASRALWNEFMNFGSGNELDRYRRQLSNDDQLVSWHTVLCHAMEDNKVRIVGEVAYRYPGSLQEGCSGYQTPLDYAIHQHSNMVEVLLRAGEFVSDRTMVDVACQHPSWNPGSTWNQQSSWNRQNSQSRYTGTTGLLMLLLQLGNGNANAEWNGKTAITCAAKSCSQSQVEALMTAGAYINTRDGQGFTPLLSALAAGCDSLASEFISHGADIWVETTKGENALQIACLKCMRNAAEDLLQKGLPVDHKDNQGRTALDSAVQNDCLPIATALLDNPFTNVNEEDHSGQTALFLAIQGGGRQSLLNMLLDKGADVNHQDHDGKSPLMVAALSGRDCKVLLRHGANVAMVDQAGNTALWYAASAGSATSASSLLQGGSGSVVNQPGEKGKTPFAIACWNTHAEVARILFAHGADPNSKDDYGQNPLNLATQFTMHLNPAQKPVATPQSISTVDQWTARQRSLLGVLQVLVEAKVNLNTYDFEGFTPLLNLLRFQKNQWGVPAQAAAFSQASQDNANFLLNSGANPNMASRERFITPLAFCAYNGYPSTAQFLLAKGANRYAKNYWGKTPAQLCGGGAGQLQVAQLLR